MWRTIGPIVWTILFFLKKINPGIYGIKYPEVFFYYFGLYSKTALRIFPILCISVEDNRAHCLSKIVFQKRFLITDYRGLGVMDMDVFTVWRGSASCYTHLLWDYLKDQNGLTIFWFSCKKHLQLNRIDI